MDLDYQNKLKYDFIAKNIDKLYENFNIKLSNESDIFSFKGHENINNIANTNHTEQDIVSSIYYENFKSNNYQYKGSDKKTYLIPNLLYRKNKIKEDNEEKITLKVEKMSALFYIFKDILFILSPLIIIITFILLIIKYKRSRHILRNKKIVFNNSNEKFRRDETLNDFSAPNTSLNIKNIISRKDSKHFFNLKEIDSSDNSLDEKSKMITDC